MHGNLRGALSITSASVFAFDPVAYQQLTAASPPGSAGTLAVDACSLDHEHQLTPSVAYFAD
ncbi:hypothetical protein AMES_0378 [Amycolatopsis mediterranei S699]|uniref:Uncharacterized protein n=2 Tax=Amycolatopsis mediterranei TaxID=33910 RepID=A0A0H3CVX5_AMYMU|nr:hypothetical protein [Amycolatopsis mediterranei]ADJ42200.1 hypothetical protein AMED_0378 [Amycolatopsis mediterranei U32]AEK38880.1 hypothetical protein RAM_01940 [Amycolatopsis mediterranei S699]AFO73914.1 hypothetical protein AMES_0378 [Amycolatopsis mediterranei S699]AGT81043.1 hypothetical protein B737_0379 [Amycolatopsis mediterranei RB]KDO08423.1 hypothetical protein DV26_23270 [Amycolatopsis mediterranei]